MHNTQNSRWTAWNRRYWYHARQYWSKNSL